MSAIKAIIATQFDATGLKKATKEFNKLGGTLRSTLGAVGLGVGLAAITSGLKESAQAAVEDTKSQALLAQQLRNTTGATDVAIASSELFIKSLQLQTSIADDELRPALATLVRATGNVSEAQSLLALSTDIAAGTGKDLSSVSAAVGKAAAGQTTALFKLIPSLKGSANFAKDAGIAFGGMAEAAANNDPFQRINVIMGEMQETIGMALLPTLNDFAAWFASPEGQAQVQKFVDVIVDGIGFLTDFADYIAENIDWLSQLAIGIGVTTAAIGLFNIALNTNPIMLAITAIGLLVTAMMTLNKVAGISSSSVPTAVNAAAVKAGQNAYDAALRNKSNFEQTATGPKLKAGAAMVAEKARVAAYDKAIADYKKSILEIDRGLKSSANGLVVDTFTPDPTKVKTSGGKAATDYVAEFYKNIADEASKQRAAAKLTGLGLSEGLVDSIISSQDWRKVFIKVKNSGGAALSQLQGDFNKTAAGAQELADNIKEVEKYTADVAEINKQAVIDIARETEQLTQEANAAIQQNNDQLAEFEKTARGALTSTIKTLNAYRTLGQEIDMGRFESEIMSAFDNVKSGLDDALANKSITQEAYNNLLDYASKENDALRKIGVQRDALAKKKSAVSAIMDDVKASFIGFANINQVAQSAAQTVTETTSRIVNGLTIQTKRTFETTKAGASVAENLKTMVEKARNFVSVLKTLKQQGLNADLFKQIVDAGVESGTATAEGILAGGPENIAEINNLFKDLQDVAAQAGETTAVVMENEGKDVAGGFLNGLMSQDENLKNLALGMGESFAVSFELSLMVAIEAAINAAKDAATAANAVLMSELKKQIDAITAEINAARDKAIADLGAAPGGGAVNETKQLTGPQTFRLGDIKLGDFGTGLSGASGLAQKLINSKDATAWNTSITINAGMGTDGKSVGQLITAELNKFAKANGIKVS
jgi:hypothetical protein